VRGQPNAKPRAERAFWAFERSFLNGRTFTHLDDIRAQLVIWIDRIVDPRRTALASQWLMFIARSEGGHSVR
jgi:hypothetical protein